MWISRRTYEELTKRQEFTFYPAESDVQIDSMTNALESANQEILRLKRDADDGFKRGYEQGFRDGWSKGFESWRGRG